jgi:MFS family permease
VITVGCLIILVGLVALLTQLQVSGTGIRPWELLPSMMVVGLGNGLSFPALIGAVLAGVHPRQAGGAAGILTTAQQFSSALGVAVLGMIFFSALGNRPTQADFVDALQLDTLLALGLTLIATVLTVLLRTRTATRSSVKTVEVVELVS